MLHTLNPEHQASTTHVASYPHAFTPPLYACMLLHALSPTLPPVEPPSSSCTASASPRTYCTSMTGRCETMCVGGSTTGGCELSVCVGSGLRGCVIWVSDQGGAPEQAVTL